jgi:hypothetical protein
MSSTVGILFVDSKRMRSTLQVRDAQPVLCDFENIAKHFHKLAAQAGHQTLSPQGYLGPESLCVPQHLYATE